MSFTMIVLLLGEDTKLELEGGKPVQAEVEQAERVGGPGGPAKPFPGILDLQFELSLSLSSPTLSTFFAMPGRSQETSLSGSEGEAFAAEPNPSTSPTPTSLRVRPPPSVHLFAGGYVPFPARYRSYTVLNTLSAASAACAVRS